MKPILAVLQQSTFDFVNREISGTRKLRIEENRFKGWLMTPIEVETLPVDLLN